MGNTNFNGSPPQSPEFIYPAMLSNSELIQTFVRQSCEQREVLLANPELRAESVCGANQLFAKGEGLILTTRSVAASLQFSAKCSSSHWNELAGALVEHSFLMTGEPDQRHFYTFQYDKIPQGYQPHCTESVMLWRSWWKYRQRIVQVTLPKELLIRARNTWYPIRHIGLSDGILFLPTFGSEIQLHTGDLVIWLSKKT